MGETQVRLGSQGGIKEIQTLSTSLELQVYLLLVNETSHTEQRTGQDEISQAALR